jgi:hypothetical protein
MAAYAQTISQAKYLELRPMKQTKRSRSLPFPALFVCVPSAQADRTEASLRAIGLTVTRADNICVAELFADAERFEAAIYDQSLSQQEQISLARVMRIRWPWMRIIRFTSSSAPLTEHALFDCNALSESQLTECVERTLAGG